MIKPVILTVDDEPEVLNAIERDLRSHYHQDYRIIKANGPGEAIQSVKEMKQRGMAVALFLVDHRMPEMTGTEFLVEAQKFYPDAKKVLLTAYADTDAAIMSINDIGLDYYLLKPWSPPELNMYPVLDDLLGDWVATSRLPYNGIRVAGTQWSAKCHDTKDFLARNRIPYQWLDIEKNSEAALLVESIDNTTNQLPVLFFPDGTVLIEPDFKQLAEKCGLQTQAEAVSYDLIIVGAGPAGLGAAVYGASEGLNTLLLDMEATGGQAGTSSKIENYLGFPNGVSGLDLANRATTQAKRLGAEILTAQKVIGVRLEDPYRIVVLEDGTELSCKALILAMGVTLRKLAVPGMDQLSGSGIYYGAAVSEAAHYRDKPVFVVGGANSAGQGAMFLSRYASRVTMLVRGNSLKESMSQYLIDQIKTRGNIEVRTQVTIQKVIGNNALQKIVVKDSQSEETEELEAAALFIFIGAAPHTEIIRDLVQCDEFGFIQTGADLLHEGKRPRNWTPDRDPFLYETSVPGIFAVGDVRKGAVRRVASAVGQGSTVVSVVHQYLKSV